MLDSLQCLDMILVLFTIKDSKNEVVFNTTFMYDNKLSEQDVISSLQYQYKDKFVSLDNIAR